MVIHEPHAQINMQHMHTHNAVNGRIEAKRLVSRQKQLDFFSQSTHPLLSWRNEDLMLIHK